LIEPVRLEELPGTPLAVVRRQVSRAELVDALREGCGRAFAFARSHNLPAGRNVGLYWDGSIRLEAGVELAADFAEQDGIVRSATPSGLTAFVRHIGPYEHLGRAHAAIRDWCAANGKRLAGPNWEIYGHWQTEWNSDPSQIRTDVYYQVAPGSP
jgi:effector-binding domain-containing protein